MLRAARLPAVVVAILALAPVATATDSGPSAEAEINRALRGRDYDQALTLIHKAMADADGAAAREALMFRRGLALFYGEKHAAAIAAFSEQLETFGQGPWAHKARLLTADAHVALRQFDAAERIYAQRVRELVGDARKARIAKVYLDFADEYFETGDTLVRPDYGKARGFYQRALDLEPGEALRDELLYKQSLCYQKLFDWVAAANGYDRYLLVFDTDYRALRKARNAGAPLPAAAAKPGKYIVEARLGLGESRLSANQHTAARRTFQDLIKLIETETSDRKKLAPVWVKATYQLAKTYHMPTPPDAKNLSMGVQTLTTLLEHHPESKEAIDGAHDIGRAHAHLGRDDDAIRAFEALIARDVIRPADDEARKLAETRSQDALFAIGRLYFGQKKYTEAIGVWNQYVAKYPSGPLWSASQQAIVDAEYTIGVDARHDERYDDARSAWTTFLQKHPLDGRAAGVLYAFGDMSYVEQKNREKAGESPNWQTPIHDWRKLVNKFPSTEESGHAQYRIGVTLERKTGDLKAAIEAYKKLTWSSYAAKAAQRIARMKAVRLNVLTERVFRTDETPKVHVDVRNIDKLTVKLYRIDMEDYFRKSQTIRGVEGLDLALIDPDKAFEVAVKDYAKYRPITQDVEIPFDGPGVYAVTLTNEKSRADKGLGHTPTRLTATTLLVRSDIDVISKSSRKQMLVFAQNMLTQKPAEGVHVLISDGDKVVVEGRTGPDGAWLVDTEKIKPESLGSVDGRSVFVHRDGHIAGDRLSLSGLGFSTGLQPRGYIYTDRPTYRPGDGVNIRGVLREVADGAYVLPPQPEDARLRWKLDVIDAKGRVLHSEAIALTAFGSFGTSFRVAPDAAVGDYRLIVRRADGPSFSGGFSVQTYQLSKAYLRFDFDEPVVMRGRKITGSVVAKYHYGEPVVDKEIEYQIDLPTGDTILRTGRTDAEGKVAFTFETTMLPEEGTVWFHARQAELEIVTAGQVFVAVRTFRAEIETLRPLFLSEEAVEVTVKTKDLKGKPIAQAMTVTAYLRSYAKKRWSETKVEMADVTTDKDKGVGRASLNLVKGGTYVLRVEGKDTFGHIVSAETTVNVSDDKDKTRIRLFSDRQHYKVGETIEFDLHSRLETQAKEEATGASAADRTASFLALITCEGEGIISYRTVTIAKGHNPFDVPVGNELFPNAAVSVAIMASRGFHTASRDITVERQLHIAIKPDKTTYRPRDEMTLELTVTDQQGKPVVGEIGVAMVDNALLSQYPDETPDIVAFFQEGATRKTEARTASSCTFRYQASTTWMATELLEEESRLAAAENRVEIVASEALWDTFSIHGAAVVDRATAARAAPADGLSVVMGTGTRLDVRRPGRGGGGGQGGARWLEGGGSKKPKDAIMRSTARRRGLGGGQSTGGDSDNEVYDFEAASNLSYAYQYQFDPSERMDKAKQREFLGREVRRQVFAMNKLAFTAGFAVDTISLGERMAEIIATAPPRSYFPEVAYWNPQIVTDADGKATVKIIMPDSSTKWRVMARGVTKETLAGQGTIEVLSKNDFVAELLTPLALVEGDAVRPRAQVHCLTPYTGKIDVRLEIASADGAGEPIIKKTTIEVDGSGVHDVAFDILTVPECRRLVLTCTATTQGDVAAAGRPLTDAVTKEVPVRPWGMRIESHAAGVAQDNEFVEIALPADKKTSHHDRQLVVAVGSNMQRWLIEEALESGPRWRSIDASLSNWHVTPPRTHADAASVLIGSLYAADYVRSQADGNADGSADLRLLDERIASLAAQLLASQNDDGGWPWCGKASDSDPWATSRIAWALGKARRDGHPIADEAARKLIAYLKKTFADARTTQTELKALVLHGISWIDEADFSHANRLYRNRESLNTSALAHLALVFVRLERDSIAAELLAVLDKRAKEITVRQRTCRVVPATRNSAWMHSDIEVTALALLAQLHVDARGQKVGRMVDYLASRARTNGWQPHKAKGCILAALSTYYAGAALERDAYTLTVSVNGKTLRETSSDEGGSIRIDLSEADLVAGQQRVDFAFKGRGRYAYAVTLSGFARTFPTPEAAKNGIMRVYPRKVLPPELQYKGRVVKAGFSVVRDLGEQGRFHNTAKSVPVGGVIDVSVRLRRFKRSETAAGDRDYLIVQESIPAGFRLLTETLEGRFKAHDYANNVLTLYYGSGRHPGTLHYKMVATTEGTYRMPPTVIRSLYRPEVFHVNKSGHTLTVLPRAQRSEDKYRMSPDELYHFGRLYFDDENYPAAAAHLDNLLAGTWILEDKHYRESVRMLLTCALKRDDAEAIVNYFEILREKYPELVVPFEEIIRIAAAYAATGQHERAYVIYRATADASFVRDSRVGRALQEEGRFLDSIDFLENLWRDYPDTPQVQSVYFALSQTLYAKAEDPASVRPRRTDGGDEPPTVTRAAIIRESIRLMESFLTMYPESPVADEASYSLTNAYLDLDAFDIVIARTKELIRLFPKSKWLDRFRYMQALAYFNRADFDRALSLAMQVAESTFRDKQGVVRPSPNKWLALYIVGQIYDAQSKTAKAIEFYEKVKSRFSDAADAVNYFEHKFVKLPEVTIFHPDGKNYRESEEWERHLRSRKTGASHSTAENDVSNAYAAPFVRIDFRNIKSAVLQVYRVDLMKLALVEKNLNQITSVNLAGIKPIVEKTVQLGDGHDYVDKSERVMLALASDEKSSDGAYLVICRGDSLFSSGLILVTPLAVQVREDTESQRARISVVDALSRGGEKNVHVKVIGTGMSRFVSGETDLRGVFAADGISGYPTAIAQDDDGHFAFYRSESVRLAMAPAQTGRVTVIDMSKSRGKAQYRQNLQFDNRAIQGSNQRLLEGMFQQQERGVEVRNAN